MNDQTKKSEVAMVTVKCIKKGWEHKGKPVNVDDEVEVREDQAKRLKNKGLVA